MVADVVECAGEPIHVVAVERRHERAVEQVDDLVSEPVALVLGVLDVPRERVAVVRETVEQPYEQPRDLDVVLGRVVVEVVELATLRDEVDPRP